MIKAELIVVAKKFLVGALLPFAEDAVGVLSNAARDTFESVITGRQTIDEWAEIAIKGIDGIKYRVQKKWLGLCGRQAKFCSVHKIQA